MITIRCRHGVNPPSACQYVACQPPTRVVVPWIEPALSARVTAGRAANAAGRSHESSLSDLHDLYRAQGRAFIRRRPHETRMVKGKDGKPRWIPVGPTGADFCGWLANCYAIVVEAKTLARGNKNSLVLRNVHDWPQAERDELADAAQTTGVPSLVVVDVREGRYAGRWLWRVYPMRADEMRAGTIRRVVLMDDDQPDNGAHYCPDGDYLKVLGL